MRTRSRKLCARCSEPVHRVRFTYCSPQCRGFAQRETAPYSERFWAKVDKDGPIPEHTPYLGQCWLWIGARGRNGYGRFKFRDGVLGAHVVAYILTFGELPSDKPWVLHACDGGSIGCVRPSHLFAGNSPINERDKVAKGRQRRGEQAGVAKLTQAQIIEILTRWAAGGITQRALAAEYHVSFQHMSLIVRRKTWTHVDFQPHDARTTSQDLPMTPTPGA